MTNTTKSQAGLTEALKTYETMRDHVGGCSDGGCLVKKPTGMHTNGGCRCHKDTIKAARMMWAGDQLFAAASVLAAQSADASNAATGQPVAWAATSEDGEVEALGFNQSRRFDTPLYFAAAAAPASDIADAYVGAREDVTIWKRRALEAEELNRKFMREINGPTHMGEPVVAAPAPAAQAAYSCAKRAADPSNEFAACRQWCGDADSCLNSGIAPKAEFDLKKFRRYVDILSGMSEEERESAGSGVYPLSPELIAASQAVNQTETRVRKRQHQSGEAGADARDAARYRGLREAGGYLSFSDDPERYDTAVDAFLESRAAMREQQEKGGERG